MPDGQHFLSHLPENEPERSATPYCPPVALLFLGLDTTELDFARPRVSVASTFLRFLIGELARAMPFDSARYAQANPDVEAARLAGDIKTLHQHFIEQGYFERRPPHDLAFDPFYYINQYEDLRAAFSEDDSAATQAHFFNHGWQEGRVGIASQRADADRWVSAARNGAASAG